MNRRVPIPQWWRFGAGAVLCLALVAAAFASAPTTATADSSTKKPASNSKRTAHSSKSTLTHKTKSASSKQASTPSSKKKGSHAKKGSKSTRTSRKRGQQVIDHDRARAIQEALIREHYLNSGPSGTWDAQTQAAMQRYQADQGWQSKTTPDSRALIKLGLGPSNDHLLNPESAMTSAPPAAVKTTPKADPPAENTPQQNTPQL